MGIHIKQSHYEALPNGEYVAQIAAIEEEASKFGPQLRFTFDLAAPDLVGRTMTGWCSAKFSPKSKLFLWTQAALGATALGATTEFDSEVLLERIVRLDVVTVQRPDGSTYNKIRGVRAAIYGDTAPLPVGVLAYEEEERHDDRDEIPF